MGAIDAFVNTFSLMVKNKNLYVLALIMSLILAPLSVYVLPQDLAELEMNQTAFQGGDVIVEEHGGALSEEFTQLFEELLKALAVLLVISLILSSIFQYSVTRGALAYIKGEQYSLSELIVEGIRHFPGTLLINIIYSIISVALIGAAALLVVAGVLTLPVGVVLIILGLLLVLVVSLLAIALSELAIPLYADKGHVGDSFEAFRLVLKNMLSSLGFGLLILVGIFGIMVAMSPVQFIGVALLDSEAGRYISAFIQAPFEALLYTFLWVAGVTFYEELKKKEELKKVEEEILDLGIEI
ncbi:MAG: hypothetical protein PWQ95_171 [Thermococcaceae archaeon]|nr:hypothetical protein [Thermococcaceae archaeon]